MNEENYSQNNKVFLTGTVTEDPAFSHELYGEGFYCFKLEVPRLSEQTDVIPVTVSERLITDGLKAGDKIAVHGQFRSYNKLVEGRSKLMLTVFARDLSKDTSENVNPNSVELTGYICKQPVYRTTPFNREICDLLVAVNRAYDKADYIPCIAWGRNARFVRTIDVGQRVRLSGRIQSRIYNKRLTDDTVEARVAYELSVSRITTEDRAAFKTSQVNSENVQ